VADAELAPGTDELLDRFCASVTANVHPVDDLRGSASFKLELAAQLSRRALAACVT
jgi:CO/xanthine dehydrogenase FAD-binding subunit